VILYRTLARERTGNQVYVGANYDDTLTLREDYRYARQVLKLRPSDARFYVIGVAVTLFHTETRTHAARQRVSA
jgi:hypothetical protein